MKADVSMRAGGHEKMRPGGWLIACGILVRVTRWLQGGLAGPRLLVAAGCHRPAWRLSLSRGEIASIFLYVTSKSLNRMPFSSFKTLNERYIPWLLFSDRR